MKNLLTVIALVVIGYFIWDHFKPPTIDGPPISEDQRILYLQASGPVSVADNLTKGQWTLFLFTSQSSSDSEELERRIERCLRERVKNVRLIVINVGGLDSAAAGSLKLTKLPTAWLFDGFNLRKDEIPEILKLLGA